MLATGKTRVFIQGNIHAGEVEGKEALLLLRSIAKGERAAWFKEVVLLITPIYNADGNERVNVREPRQPERARRRDGQAPQRAGPRPEPRRHEAGDRRGALARRGCSRSTTRTSRFDLHTTDGSDHGYYLTYESRRSPNTSAGITGLLRNELFPAVTRR